MSLLIIVLAGAGLYSFWRYTQRPQVQTEYWDISLDSTKLDIKFLKGAPTKVEGKVWRFETYDVIFEGESDTIRYVLYRGGKSRDDDFHSTGIQGIYPNTRLEEVLKKFGDPSNISTSKNGTKRIYSFERYRVFFELEKNKVTFLGMYNSESGPVHFAEEMSDDSE